MLMRKTSLPVSSTCTIGGGGTPPYLWKTSKNKQVTNGSLVVISYKTVYVLRGPKGGHYAVC